MQKISIGVGLMIFLLLASCSTQSLAQVPFKPAEVISAGDIPYPIQSIANGVVVLDVSLDEKGAVTGSTVVRDIPSLTSAADRKSTRLNSSHLVISYAVFCLKKKKKRHKRLKYTRHLEH